jgi:5-methyltetrahydrofolate--homocysteine methyltransferase
MTLWKSRLEKKKVLILDGAWGTELFNRGLKPPQVPDAWNIERPEEVLAVALSYVNAGADIILTNTFGGSPLKLAKAGLERKTAEINRLGAEISKKAAHDRALVFGSIGPTGEFVAPLGKATETEMVKVFAEQAKALAAGGVDGIVIETMMDLTEAKAALRAVRENTSLPVAVTMTFIKAGGSYATLMGVRPEQAAAELERLERIWSARTGHGMMSSSSGTADASGHGFTDLVMANAGLPELVDGNTVYRETPEQMASKLAALVEAGATMVVGAADHAHAHPCFALERDKLTA